MQFLKDGVQTVTYNYYMSMHIKGARNHETNVTKKSNSGNSGKGNYV